MLDMEMMEGAGNGGSQQPSCSDSGHILAIRKMLEEEFEPMVLKIVQQVVKPIVITTVKQEIVPVAEDLFRRVVKEEIQPLKEKLLAGGTRNDSPKERTLQLKFSDEVSDTVQTSTELKSKNNECLELVLVDSTGKTAESSAKVEITLHNEDDSDGDSESGITVTEDKGKPHFSKSVYKLKDGVVSLSGLKLAHGKDWTKLCKCRLRARIAQNLEGITVQDASTAPFMVIDKRIKHYKKHPLPSLLSEVWRLKNIGRNGEPCKRLEKKRIEKLRDFLFWLYVNPEELQRQILRVGDGKWETMIAHARSRDINEDKRMYTHKSSGEPQMRVVYDVVGELKGVIDESCFIRIDNLSADKKDDAHKLLRSLLEPSAFVQRYETFFDDEASLLQQFPLVDPQNSGRAAPVDPGLCFENLCLPISVEASLPFRSSHEIDTRCPNGTGPALSENIYQTTERGSSSESIDPNNMCDSEPSHSLGSKQMGELCNPTDHEKHETPTLFDEVSRLVNICKDGEIHRRLRVNKINTVEDFLIQLLIDQEGIRHIVSLEREEWEATVSNATRACSTGNGTYCYTSLKLMKGVVFNLLGDVLGLLSFEKHFCPTSTLSEHDKGEARELLASARKNWRDVEPYNELDRLHAPPTASGSDSLSWYKPYSATEEEWRDFLCPSPNPMLEYCNWSCNAQIVVNPKRWKKFSRLWFLLKEWMSIDETCKSKKRKLC